VDLGEVILAPGLINAHCHLDCTRLAGLLEPPSTFPAWIQALLAHKASWTAEDQADSWLDGARSLLRNGVTTTVNIETAPERLDRVLPQTPLRICSLLELIDLRRSDRGSDPLVRALAQFAAVSSLPGWRGLAPHSPYTASPPLIQTTAALCAKRAWPWSIHVAESEAEFEMFTHGCGSMFNWLGVRRDMSDCGRGSPVQHLERCGAFNSRCLVVHANYLGAGDLSVLARHGIHVVHCPRSHDFFGHRRFDWEGLRLSGINVCLGTDGLASVRAFPPERPELDLFKEMDCFARAFPAASPESILEMVTLNPARALGQAGGLGQISAGAYADLIAVPFAGRTVDASAALVHHSGGVCASMIGGLWVVPPRTGVSK
jgi:cytosine/adenosine deaminase-related metal-dependent hydrolase